jgi:hypothetical protein
VQLTEAQTALASAQARIGELEAVRRKLHNAVLVTHMPACMARRCATDPANT